MSPNLSIDCVPVKLWISIEGSLRKLVQPLWKCFVEGSLLCKATNRHALADDSGITCRCPSMVHQVYILARYAGRHGDDNAKQREVNS